MSFNPNSLQEVRHIANYDYSDPEDTKDEEGLNPANDERAIQKAEGIYDQLNDLGNKMYKEGLDSLPDGRTRKDIRQALREASIVVDRAYDEARSTRKEIELIKDPVKDVLNRAKRIIDRLHSAKKDVESCIRRRQRYETAGSIEDVAEEDKDILYYQEKIKKLRIELGEIKKQDHEGVIKTMKSLGMIKEDEAPLVADEDEANDLPLAA